MQVRDVITIDSVRDINKKVCTIIIILSVTVLLLADAILQVYTHSSDASNA